MPALLARGSNPLRPNVLLNTWVPRADQHLAAAIGNLNGLVLHHVRVVRVQSHWISRACTKDDRCLHSLLSGDYPRSGTSLVSIKILPPGAH